jgi:hypothetical protein
MNVGSAAKSATQPTATTNLVTTIAQRGTGLARM